MLLVWRESSWGGVARAVGIHWRAACDSEKACVRSCAYMPVCNYVNHQRHHGSNDGMRNEDDD